MSAEAAAPDTAGAPAAASLPFVAQPGPYTGGCLCGAVRYVADGEPTLTGLCFCADCRKASGSGFIPFMGFPAERVVFTGTTLRHEAVSWRGTPAVRNSCRACGGLVFGGIAGVDPSHTIYAGSLDDATRFVPRIAIFTRDRPAWAVLPDGLTAFATMPPSAAVTA